MKKYISGRTDISQLNISAVLGRVCPPRSSALRFAFVYVVGLPATQMRTVSVDTIHKRIVDQPSPSSPAQPAALPTPASANCRPSFSGVMTGGGKHRLPRFRAANAAPQLPQLHQPSLRCPVRLILSAALALFVNAQTKQTHRQNKRTVSNFPQM